MNIASKSNPLKLIKCLVSQKVMIVHFVLKYFARSWMINPFDLGNNQELVNAEPSLIMVVQRTKIVIWRAMIVHWNWMVCNYLRLFLTVILCRRQMAHAIFKRKSLPKALAWSLITYASIQPRDNATLRPSWILNSIPYLLIWYDRSSY